MTREELQRFCSTDKDRQMIATPWSAGEWSYATCGKIMVRVARLADVPERSDAPQLNAEFRFDEDGDWRDIPILPDPLYYDCRDCGGHGIERKECSACDGWGEIDCTCADCGGTHTRSCKACGGHGYTTVTTGKPCQSCAGSGKLEAEQLVGIRKEIFDVRLLRRIVINLSNHKIMPDGINMAPITFVGGRGYLMPR